MYYLLRGTIPSLAGPWDHQPVTLLELLSKWEKIFNRYLLILSQGNVASSMISGLVRIQGGHNIPKSSLRITEGSLAQPSHLVWGSFDSLHP